MKPFVVARSVGIILAAGAALVMAHQCGICLAGIQEEMVPSWVIMGFGYLCALPGLLLPYVALAFVAGRERSKGIVSGIIAGITYPVALAALTRLGESVFGQPGDPHYINMAWDCLVEHATGWLIMAAITLLPGVALSYVAIRLDNKCNEAFWPVALAVLAALGVVIWVMMFASTFF